MGLLVIRFVYAVVIGHFPGCTWSSTFETSGSDTATTRFMAVTQRPVQICWDRSFARGMQELCKESDAVSSAPRTMCHMSWLVGSQGFKAAHIWIVLLRLPKDHQLQDTTCTRVLLSFIRCVVQGFIFTCVGPFSVGCDHALRILPACPLFDQGMHIICGIVVKSFCAGATCTALHCAC